MKLIYIYDPLCGWCYGFSPVMQRILAAQKGKMEFEILSGGMMLGRRAGSINEVAPFIKTAYKNVESYTGVKFGAAFINNLLLPGHYILNSEKPCMALTAFKTFKPEAAFEFAHALQSALYFDGQDLNEDKTYENLIKPYGIDAEAFLQRLKSQENKAATYAEFKKVEQLGASGFPMVVLVKDGKKQVLTTGYSSYEEMMKHLK